MASNAAVHHSSDGFTLGVTIIERPKPGRPVLWALSASVECEDGSCVFATAGGTRVVVYIAPLAGGVDIVCELETPVEKENFYTVSLTALDNARTHLLAVAGELGIIQLWNVSTQR
jgi:hypothetical protein